LYVKRKREEKEWTEKNREKKDKIFFFWSRKR